MISSEELKIEWVCDSIREEKEDRELFPIPRSMKHHLDVQYQGEGRKSIFFISYLLTSHTNMSKAVI